MPSMNEVEILNGVKSVDLVMVAGDLEGGKSGKSVVYLRGVRMGSCVQSKWNGEKIADGVANYE